MVAVDGLLLSLAANAATGEERWPGALDLLRTHSWWSVAVLTALLVVSGLLVTSFEQPGRMDGDPPPPPAPTVDRWLVPRAELRAAVAAVLSRRRRTVGLTTSLHGAGGFGKTRLARMVCADRRVRRHFRGRVYQVTVGRDVRSAAEIAAKVSEAAELITGERVPFTDLDRAGDHFGRLLEQRPRTLLVLDDVWEREQLEPFLRGAPKCVRLVTTRRRELLEAGPRSRLVLVDGMTDEEARQVLLQDLDPLSLSADVVAALLAQTGRWPLLLRLVNRLIVSKARLGIPAGDAARAALRRLRQVGPVAGDAAGMDAAVAAEREQAVGATVEAAVDLLPTGGRDRYRELGVFAEDEAVPLALVCRLWQATAGHSEDQSHDLVSDLAGLSLITIDPTGEGRIGLHDVHRDYLHRVLGAAGLARIQRQFIDAVTADLPSAGPLATGTPDPGHAWWDTDDGYVLDHAVEHLLAAGYADRAEALATDLRWIDRRLYQRGPSGPVADLFQVGTPDAVERARDLTRAAHLLQRTSPEHALTAVLHSRLADLPRWHAQVTAHAGVSSHPRLSNLGPLPDPPEPSMRRAITTPEWVYKVAISPDGTWLVTHGSGGTVRIWDRATGAPISTLSGQGDALSAVAISPDGTWIATGGSDGRVRIWDRTTGTQTMVLARHGGSVHALEISRDGTWLATVGNDGRVRIWDRATGAQTATLPGRSRNYSPLLAISPDGTWIATGNYYDMTVRIWDRVNEPGVASFPGHWSALHAVAISPDGTWLAAADDDGMVRLWDRLSGTQTAALAGHRGTVFAVAISPDGTWLASAGKDGTVRIWDRTTGAQTATFSGHSGALRAVAISPDGTWLTACGDKVVRIWDRTDGTAAHPGHPGGLHVVKISPDGAWMATGRDDGTVGIVETATGNHTTSLPSHTGGLPRSLAISADGTLIVTGDSSNGVVRTWDRATGSETATLSGHAGIVQALGISPDGTLLAIAGGDRKVRIWDRAAGSQTAIFDGRDILDAVAFSPDGTWLAAGGLAVRIWDCDSGTRLATLNDRGYAPVVAISPDGTWLAAGGLRAARIWDRASGTQIATLPGHTGVVRGLAISPDGTWIATGCENEIRVWSASTHAPVAMVRIDSDVTCCAWSSDSTSVIVGSRAGLYRFRFHPPAP
ncbi:NB-ARC domain-containing protein [Kitasatospora indigofera]|uniref:NB-ARC domain-containing protein n=1 Tax=Kitasatospora indigofera TaxID=67307 RepID=UPI00367CF834